MSPPNTTFQTTGTIPYAAFSFQSPTYNCANGGTSGVCSGAIATTSFCPADTVSVSGNQESGCAATAVGRRGECRTQVLNLLLYVDPDTHPTTPDRPKLHIFSADASEPNTQHLRHWGVHASECHGSSKPLQGTANMRLIFPCTHLSCFQHKP